MKLATLRIMSDSPTNGRTVAVRVDKTEAIEIAGVTNIGSLLQNDDWRSVAERADGVSHSLQEIDPQQWAPVVPQPSKIICVGLNYRSHILEMGRGLPEHPTFFSKYPEALIGPFDDVELPSVSQAIDWEGELAVIIAKKTRSVSEEEAGEAIAGYAILNDVTARDYQYRTLQWLQGKTFENTCPFGPFMVTTDEFEPGPTLTTTLDGELMQSVATSDLVFNPAKLISYFSDIITLNAGDVIATGTPGGVGHVQEPQRYLTVGSTLETSIIGLGDQSNPVVAGR